MTKRNNDHPQPGKPEVKLLVVDDREDNLLSIEAILAPDGYTIRKADSGRAALKALLKEQDFTLILMDVQMPNLNGFETASMIYESDKLRHIPIIFITANDQTNQGAFIGYRTGGVDYIQKPVNPDLLRAKVSVFVELYRKNHALMAHEQKLKETNRRLEREILERKASEERVRLLNEQLLDNINQLRNTNDELERFAYVASHDLQEPLRKIMLFGGRLSSKYQTQLGDEGNGYIDRMVKASERMQTLIDNILTYSRSTVAGSFEETDMNKLVRDVLLDLDIYIAEKKAIIDVSELPTLQVIPSQMRQLMQNLLVNAIKFSKPGVAPAVRVFAETATGMHLAGVKAEQYDDAFCNLYIKDNGIGFEQHYAEQIFTSFKRLHSYERYEGSGLGLSICKKIVEKHRGYISASGRVDEGATFMVSLPIKREPANVVVGHSSNGLVEPAEG
ncbi:MAG TPA: response regulator [Chitinophagales bacterium]|nr:response regulator [Chitinophagales bacterium]